MEEEEPQLTSTTDLCQQLMSRYKSSSAKQHQHLLATAAALQSLISSESLPLTPTSYFAATISSIDTLTADDDSIDSVAVGALTSLLSLALPLVKVGGIESGKAGEAVGILVRLLGRGEGGLVSASSVRGVVKCLGVLLVAFCDFRDWDSLWPGLEMLLKFSVDKRPKVRKCAQTYVETIFTSFEDSNIKKKGSNMIASLFETHVPSIVELSKIRLSSGSTFEAPSKPEYVEALHFMNVLKLAIPFLSVKNGSKILKKLLKFMISELTPLTRHILINIEAYFLASKFESISPSLENMLVSLSAFFTKAKNKPLDTEKAVLNLLRNAIDRLRCDDYHLCIKWLPILIGSILENIMSDSSSADHVLCALKEIIIEYAGQSNTQYTKGVELTDDKDLDHPFVLGLCLPFENALKRCEGCPNVHILEVVSILIMKLGANSYLFMKGILHRLAELMVHCNATDTAHLQHCIGASIIAMGPEKVLSILPIVLNGDFTVSNTWLIPILGKYVRGASLDFYMNHILPQAESLQQACGKVKNIVTRKELKGLARALRALLPAFCRHPTDAHQNIEPLSKLLITFIKKDSHMHKSVAVALKELLNQSTTSDEEIDATGCIGIKDFRTDLKNMASIDCDGWATLMTNVLEALTEQFLKSTLENRLYFQSAMECLVSVVDSSTTKRLLWSLLGKSTDGMSNQEEKPAESSSLLELASPLCKGADEALLDKIFDLIKDIFQGDSNTEHFTAFSMLRKVIQEHVNYSSKHLNELMDLIYPVKSDIEKSLLEARFHVLHVLLVLIIKENLSEEEEKAFIVLNEIILKLKDSDEDVRKLAHDTLLAISSSLHDPSSSSFETYNNFVTMVTGYLCGGSAPENQSAAISALSVLIYKDPHVFILVPDVLPSVLSVLKTKSTAVVKSVLGFVKVLVSCLQAKDLQTFLPGILNGILPWSVVAKHFFREKVIIIMEILVRKCGFAAIETVTPKKYEKFVKTVRENLHGKIKTADDESMETIKETPAENPKGWRKRKTSESALGDESNKRNMDKHFRKSEDSRQSTSDRRPREKETRGQQYGPSRGRKKEHYPKDSRRKFVNGKGAKR